jgi:hypothetical protein
MRGRSLCGNPGTRAPTVAEVPGSAEGLGGAVVEDCGDEAELNVGAAAVVPVPAGVQAAKASNVPAAARAAVARLRCPNTFTGIFLLVLTRGVDAESASSLVSPRA